MKASWPVIIFFSFFLVPCFGDLIDDACHKTSDFNLCATSLRSDPHSSSADLKGLTRIMIQLGLAKANQISAQVKLLLNQSKDRGFKQCLQICLEEFGYAIDPRLPDAIKYLNSNDYWNVDTNLVGAGNSAETCEESFTEPPGYTSPLAEVDKNFDHFIEVTRDLLSQLKQK
ncbi:PREDICTED: pectinesterase inhibitor-like [Nicotiana attenuata]|uniref:Invertase inhibitor n=1 Tax=Nicotiana attenuata TaxID=49451 RepID=A0A314KXL9_NICAT|nr:PREDICTED: pectinesterase inhibitor-like [Nicotiana attenuata]OIT33539.1 putative invertase inhibitor [Nicotiana attenuata]